MYFESLRMLLQFRFMQCIDTEIPMDTQYLMMSLNISTVTPEEHVDILPINDSNAHDGSYSTRIYHHNDCFRVPSNDFSTYVDPVIEYLYLNKETKYTILGGERKY